MGMLTPLTNFLGQDLSSVMPKVPELNISLPDIMNGNPQDLINSVKAKLDQGITFPNIPSPLFPDMSIPQFESIQITGNLIKSYLMTIPDFIFGLINQVTGKLKLPGMPSLPTMPSLSDVQAMIMSKVDGATSYLDVIKSGLSMNQIFDFQLPSFPKMPSLPDPLIPNVKMPEFEFNEYYGNLMNHLTAFNLQPCMDFCNGTLGSKLPFSFPTMCVPFTPTV